MMHYRNSFQFFAKILAVYTLLVFTGLVLKNCSGCKITQSDTEVRSCCSSTSGTCTPDCCDDNTIVIKADTDLVPVLDVSQTTFDKALTVRALIMAPVVAAPRFQSKLPDEPFYPPERDLYKLHQVFLC